MTTESEEYSKLKIKATTYSGLLSGFIYKSILHPIDTLRAKIIVNQADMSSRNILRHGVLKYAAKTFKKEGIRGFYQGMGIACFGAIPGTALYFWAYEKSKYEFSKRFGWDNSALMFFTCGMIAEAISCVLWVPIDIVKERLQVQSTLKSFRYKNTFDAIKQIYKKEGFFALYKAYGATLMVFGPYTAISMSMYDKIKIFYGYTTETITFGQSFLLAMSAGGLASFVTNPFDVVKVRMQVQRAERIEGQPIEKGRYGYKNIFHGLMKVVKEEKFRGLWRGSFSRILHMSCYSALALSLVDTIRGKVMVVLKSQK